MDHLEKTTIIKGKFAVICIFSLIFFVGGIWLSLFAYKETARYNDVLAHAEYVPAVVSKIVDGKDVDDNTEYRTYVTYTYRGVTYTVYYHSFATHSVAYATLGKEVTILVNPENPGENVENLGRNTLMFWYFGAGLTGVGVLMLEFRIRKWYTQEYGWVRTYWEADVRDIVVRSIFGCIALATVASLLLLAWLNNGHISLLITTILFVIFTVLSVIHWKKKMKLIHDGDIRCTRDTLVDKSWKHDSDGPDFYYLHYANDAGTWKRSVSKKLYQEAQPGDTIESVYLGKEKRPLLTRCNVTQNIE